MTPTNSTPGHNGDDRHRLSIGVLSITAMVLLVGIVVVSSINRSALAIGMSDRGGDYIVVTSQFTGSREAIIVTDAAAERMAAYLFNLTTRRMEPVSVFDLKKLKELKGAKADEPAGNRRPDRRRP